MRSRYPFDFRIVIMIVSLVFTLLTVPCTISALPSSGGWHPPPGNETLPPVLVTFDTYHNLPRDAADGYPLSFIMPEKSFVVQTQVLVPMKAVQDKFGIACSLSGHMEQNFRCKTDIKDIGPAVSMSCSSWPFPFDHANNKVGLKECKIINIHAEPTTPSDPEAIIIKYHLDHMPNKTSPMPIRFSAYYQNGIGDGTVETALKMIHSNYDVGSCIIDKWWPSDIWCEKEDVNAFKNATAIEMDCLRERVFGVRTCSQPKLIFT